MPKDLANLLRAGGVVSPTMGNGLRNSMPGAPLADGLSFLNYVVQPVVLQSSNIASGVRLLSTTALDLSFVFAAVGVPDKLSDIGPATVVALILNEEDDAGVPRSSVTVTGASITIDAVNGVLRWRATLTNTREVASRGGVDSGANFHFFTLRLTLQPDAFFNDAVAVEFSREIQTKLTGEVLPAPATFQINLARSAPNNRTVTWSASGAFFAGAVGPVQYEWTETIGGTVLSTAATYSYLIDSGAYTQVYLRVRDTGAGVPVWVGPVFRSYQHPGPA